MSEAEIPTHEPTNLPSPEGKINARGYELRVRFLPEIKLDRKRGHSFALSLSDYLSLEKDEYESHKWTFCEPLAGEPESRFFVMVGPSYVNLRMHFPTQPLEWVEDRFRVCLIKLGEHCRLRHLIHSEAIVRGDIPIDGDARAFLGTYVMNMDPDRFDPFGRPIHLLGVKFLFPPFKKSSGEEQGGANWAVTVRAESLIEDPSRLFLEADAEWFDFQEWTRDTPENAVKHLETVKHYLENNMIQFLKQSSEEEGDTPDENTE
jgi:hypothetical protein